MGFTLLVGRVKTIPKLITLLFCEFLQRVFSIDTIVKPLPPAVAYNASRNLNFFMRIFTQFFDPEGTANAQKTLGLGQEERAWRVQD